MSAWIDPASLVEREKRYTLSHVVNYFDADVSVDVSGTAQRRVDAVSLSIRVSGPEEMFRVLKKAGIRLSRERVVRAVTRYLAGHVISLLRKPRVAVGVDPKLKYVVTVPASRILCDDVRTAVVIASQCDNVCWVEGVGYDLSELGLERISLIPLLSVPPSVLSSVALWYARGTVGEKYADDVLAALTQRGTEVGERELSEVLVGPTECVGELFNWKVVSMTTGKIPRRAWLDVSGTPPRCRLFASIFAIAYGYSAVVLNGVEFSWILAELLRPTVVWVGNVPETFRGRRLFDVVVRDNELVTYVNVAGREVEIREGFIPLWKL